MAIIQMGRMAGTTAITAITAVHRMILMMGTDGLSGYTTQREQSPKIHQHLARAA